MSGGSASTTGAFTGKTMSTACEGAISASTLTCLYDVIPTGNTLTSTAPPTASTEPSGEIVKPLIPPLRCQVSGTLDVLATVKVFAKGQSEPHASEVVESVKLPD